MKPTELVHVRLRVYQHEPYKELYAKVLHPWAYRKDWVEDYETAWGSEMRTVHRSRDEKIPEELWPVRDDPGITRQLWCDTLYEGAPDKKLYTMRNFPVGAMWDADWLSDVAAYTGPDGISLHVRTPGGDWCVDSQASNCDKPQDQPVPDKPGWKKFVRTHYCWVRHGDPRTGNVHVDKNGNTCGAGAGSIIVGNFHGFLHNSYLAPC